MSFDQKPGRVRVYQSGVSQPGAAAGASGAAAEATGTASQTLAAGEQSPVEGNGKRVSILAALVFLVGCALGGAGVSALPHLGLF